MAAGYWITLSASWDIGNVRAVFAFLINVLCTCGIWVVGYAYWKAGASRAALKPSTKVLSLFSLSSIGDAIESLSVVTSDIKPTLVIKLLLQATCVTILCIVAILSGPIARWSTRVDLQVVEVSVPGWLATTNHNGVGGALVLWNTTIESLKAANFPLNQLLDFLPDNQVNWVYRESEWNLTWSTSCTWTDETMLPNITTTGNYSGAFLAEIPGLRAVFPPGRLEDPYLRHVGAFSNYEDDNYYKDYMAFITSQPNASSVHDQDQQGFTNSQPLNFTLAAFHLHNVTRPPNETYYFGIGPVERVSYTMADCLIERSPGAASSPDGEEAWEDFIAFPWSRTPEYISYAISNFYEAGFISQSFTGSQIYHPSGPDLFRFYQAYTVAKDTQYRVPVSRKLSVASPSVDLSVPALAILCAAVCALAGTAMWSLLRIRVPDGVWVPRTKLEWIMNGVREGSRPGSAPESEGYEKGGGGQQTVTAVSADNERKIGRRLKKELATACYGQMQ